MEKEHQAPEEILDTTGMDTEPSTDDLVDVEQEVDSEVEETSHESEKCTHHWVLESPVGGTTHGRCRHCDTEKEFHDKKSFGDSWSKLNYKRIQDAAERKKK